MKRLILIIFNKLGFSVSQFLLRLRQSIFCFGQFFFGAVPVRFSSDAIFMFIIALGNQSVDFIPDLKNVQRTGGQGRDDRHNQTNAN